MTHIRTLPAAMILLLAITTNASADEAAKPASLLNGQVRQDVSTFRLNRSESNLLRSAFQTDVHKDAMRPLHGASDYLQGTPQAGQLDAYKHWLTGSARDNSLVGAAENYQTGLRSGPQHIWHMGPFGFQDSTGNVPGIVNGGDLWRYGGVFGDGITPIPSYPLQADENGRVDWQRLRDPNRMRR